MKGNRQIARDPFGRFDTLRRTVFTSATCPWCGGHKVTRGRTVKTQLWPDGIRVGRPFLYEYGTNRDDTNRTAWQGKLFCSRSCERSYNA